MKKDHFLWIHRAARSARSAAKYVLFRNVLLSTFGWHRVSYRSRLAAPHRCRPTFITIIRFVWLQLWCTGGTRALRKFFCAHEFVGTPLLVIVPDRRFVRSSKLSIAAVVVHEGVLTHQNCNWNRQATFSLCAIVCSKPVRLLHRSNGV